MQVRGKVKPQVSDTPIICYKVLGELAEGGFVSPWRMHPYTLGEPQPYVKVRGIRTKYSRSQRNRTFEVREGYHCYMDFDEAAREARLGYMIPLIMNCDVVRQVVVKCEVPACTRFVISGGVIVSETLIAVSKISDGSVLAGARRQVYER